MAWFRLMAWLIRSASSSFYSSDKGHDYYCDDGAHAEDVQPDEDVQYDILDGFFFHILLSFWDEMPNTALLPTRSTASVYF
jgi:hypothetical protein